MVDQAPKENTAGVIYDINPVFSEEGSKIEMTDKVANCLNIDCRNPSILRSIKLRLEDTDTGVWKNTSERKQRLTTIKASLQTEPLVCEYAIGKGLIEIGREDQTNIPSFLKVSLTSSTDANKNCTYSVNTVVEYDPGKIDFIYDIKTLSYTPQMNDTTISLPLLFYYDPTDITKKYNPNINRTGKKACDIDNSCET